MEFIIAGLGNPGAKYENTRHNVGFMALDVIASEYKIEISRLKFKSLFGEGDIGGIKVMLVKPQTFMNLSGEALREFINFYKIPIKNLIVIYDDTDLAEGKIRVRPKGSSGTHNGMKSIIYNIRSDEFPRVRIGIGKPPLNWDLADFVLAKIDDNAKESLEQGIFNAAKAAVEIVKTGLDTAMNRYNR